MQSGKADRPADAALRIPRIRTRDPDFEARLRPLLERRERDRHDVDRIVSEILEDVRKRGDAALIEITERVDGYRLPPEELVAGPEEIAARAADLPAVDRSAITTVAERIRRFHASHVPESWTIEEDGDRLGQLVRPLGRVGLYVPAAQAPLASSVLMLAIPAQVAGVGECVLASPGRELHPAIAAAAHEARVDRLLRAGGAQAVAALAYGTERVPRVDKIVGPGSIWTQAAKRLVFGEVGIDAEAGPSEVLIVAEPPAEPEWLAADLLAQAEHDERAGVVLVTPSAELAEQTLEALERQIRDLPRAEVARTALADQSAVVLTRDLTEAVAIANRYAAEHLELWAQEPDRWLPELQHAGAIFVGPHSPVPAGDYAAGPSHVLPTGGTARFFSVVGVEDFQRRMSLIALSERGLARIAEPAARLAELEELVGHARALRIRGTGNTRPGGSGSAEGH